MRIFHLIAGATALLALLAGCATPKPQTETSPPPKAIAAPVPATVTAEPTHTEAQVIAAVDVPNSIFFARGSAEINAIGKVALRDHAERLKVDSKIRIVLLGYTDDLGSRAYNLAIADRRVNAVFAELRRLGVQPMQMKRSSLGTEKLSKSCISEDCRRLMRRVEIEYRD